MPISGTKRELIEVLGGKGNEVDSDLSFSGVEFDTRKLVEGNVFVGLKGESCHGETFAAKAVEAGAAIALVEDPAYLASPCSDHIIVVGDTYKALTDMAAWWRARLSAQVIAVTGSAGKTTTKGLIAHLLSGFSSGTAAEKSFNNHIGVPYTICSIDKEDAWAVLEIGMNHPGEIETLSALAKPDVAVVTSVGPVHIGHFSSIDDIAKEKFAISKGLTDDGQLVLNSDVFSVIGKKKAESLIFGSPQISTIGIEEDDSLRVSDVVVDGLDGVSFRLSNATDTFECASKLLCSVNSFNSGIAVLAAQTAFPDLKLSELCDRLATFEPPPLRLNTIRLSENRIVINDSYNANPISMAASLELLSSLQQRGAKVGAIVGDMLELGEFADRYHNEIAERIAAIPMSFVAAVGEHASELLAPSAELGVVVQVCESPEEAAQFAANQSFDIVLIKASRGIALDKAASELCSILGQ